MLDTSNVSTCGEGVQRMLRWNRRFVLMTALVHCAGVLAALGAGIHWSQYVFLG
jgi:hypothetical protein